MGGALLVDRHCRAEPFNVINVRFVHLPQELAGVGRQRLDIAALALGEDGVERQGRLARARQPGNDDKLVAWDLDRNIL